MKVQHNLCNQSFLSRFFPHSRWVLVCSAPEAQAYKRLEEALARGIVVKKIFSQRRHKSFRLTGTQAFKVSYTRSLISYTGHLVENKLIMYGPKDYRKGVYGPKSYRKVGFRTQGLLCKQGNKLVLHLLIESLTWALGIETFLLASIFLCVIIAGVMPLPYLVFLGVCYFKNWQDFSRAESQICQLLEDILNGNDPGWLTKH